MKIVLDTSKDTELSLMPKTKADAIAQQLYIIIQTVKGECPMYRDFGTDYSFKDMPTVVAQRMYISAVSDAIRKFEPDVTLTRLEFNNDSSYGEKFSCAIEVTINE